MSASNQDFPEYGDCVNYIEAVPRFTEKTEVAHTRRLLAALGDPDQQMRILHVAGTNGKGSVCAYLQAALTAGGYRTARFTSPHLERINERLAIDGEAISDEDFARCFAEVMTAARRCMDAGDPHPTYFEILFLMAMHYFADRGVDFCVLETGLGGRLDATNAVPRPLASIITSIGFDHTEQLGGTIREIAAEKAGIIKAGVPVFFEGENPEAAQVLRARAAEEKSPIHVLLPEVVSVPERRADGLRFRLCAEDVDRVLTIRQLADYQMRNAALAFLALHGTADAHGLSDGQIAEGLLRMEWPGRMERLQSDVYIDGAHNAEGAEAFARAARDLSGEREVTLIFAAAADKPVAEMARRICRILRPARVIVTEFSGGRAKSAGALAELFRAEQTSEVRVFPRAEEAFATAWHIKGKGLLFAAGSLYLLGEFRAWLANGGGEA